MKEKRALQCAVALCGAVPVGAGIAGIVPGPGFLDLSGAPGALTHAAYLSGLLLGIGVGFWSVVPAIEHKGARFALLASLVVLGGLARLIAAIRLGAWTPSVTLALVMELGVTPALWLWQRRIAKGA